MEKIDAAGYEGPLKDAVGGSILGSSDFIQEITETHIKGGEKDKDIPALRHFSGRPSLLEIIKEAKEAFQDNEKLARQAGIYLCHKYSGAPLKEIAAKFDVGVTAIGEASKRLMKKMEKDASLQKQLRNAIIRIGK